MFHAVRLSILVPVIMVSVIPPSLAGAPAATTKVQLDAPTNASPAEKVPANFPFTLQGFFGTGDGIEVSLRDKSSFKSVWLKPGESFGKWKLERADEKAQSARFVSGDQRVELRLAGEITVDPSGRFDWMKDSITGRRFWTIFRTHRASARKYTSIMIQVGKDIIKEHPEFQSASTPGIIDYKNPEAAALYGAGVRRELSASTDPDLLLLKDAELAMMDARTTVRPRDDDGKDLPAANEADQMANKDSEWLRRVCAEADRLYLSRGGSPTLEDLPPPDPGSPPEANP